ncbi:MAG: cellulase family glycosylhydrolase [Halococcoides sp.]
MAPQRQDDSRTDATASGVRRRTFLRATGAAGAMVAGTGLVGTAAAADGLPQIERDGNKLTAGGEEIELQGVNIADPKRVDVTAPARGKTAAQAIDMVTDVDRGWYADAVRLPVQPVDIGEHTPGSGPKPPAFDESQLKSYMDNHLDAAVQACKDGGAYAIIDYHRHRDIPWGSTTDGEFSPNQKLSNEVTLFWDIVAARYGDMDHVIFEMYNEPQGYPQWSATGDALVEYWGNWKSTAQPWVDTIRSHSDNLVLVGSPRWTQLTKGAVIEEFDGPNIGYTLHLYPAHGPTTPADYDNIVSYDGTPAHEIAPIVMSEWGFDPDAGLAAGGGVTKETVGDSDWAEWDPDYGKHVTEWLSTRPVHSTAWVFDPLWDPNMVEFGFDTDGSVGSPYNDEPIPEKCADLPCEWSLLTGDYMGDTVKQFLYDRMVADYAGSDGEYQPSEVVEAKGDYVTGDLSLEAVHDIMRSYFFG